VVELATASAGDDTTGVELEGGLVGLDGDGDWGLGDGGLELGGGWGNIGETFDGSNTSGFDVRAGSVLTGVWVGGLELKWVLLDIFEGVVHKTTVAALVNLIAIDELLLGEGLELAGLEEHSALDGTGGGERPA